MRLLFPILSLVVPLAACDHGNVRPLSSYHAPKPPPVRDPVYDPNAPYGSANATWLAPVYNRDGTIVKPAEPSTQAGRPDYEGAAWATGAGGGGAYTGTF
ncbi:MAG: hypothetical protein JO227_10740 [Acetobacteraceae bacterium]|nr:hypothetical protein [Acetobacteraceae bacterium]